ncbi:hypothetical protein EST38_g7522 [Candolleomyces aberdarensis]|uniref:Extracellular metalloproteinase n=1 Tax=Candolleomyces aberdarensis TaxID=2316362 RepID=A0A4Q2DGW1_9AGAR|nr:hypothetical protein EST38_g7522 [Candolleomyces aberdarensis]
MFDGNYNQHLRLAYLVRPDESAVLVHGIQIQNIKENAWYEVFVDEHTGQLVSVTDFGAKATSGTYRAVPIYKHSLVDGTELIFHPEDLEASPYGWHENWTVLSTDVWEGATYRTNWDDDDWEVVAFDYPYDQTVAPTPVENRDAASITNAFYVGNMVHDFAWRYGFKPLTFNVQSDTIQDKWARGDDSVWIRIQWTPGVSDASFTTPPDGQPGILRLYIWNKSNPSRDPALANDILFHELTHGITGRVIGGGSAACLQTLEAKGLREGWSDAMAEWTEQTSATVDDYVIGAWINNNAAGLRTYPYSTDPTINPLRYSSLAGLTNVYQIGEVWANVLHNVYAALVQAHVWASTRFTNPDTSEGNVIFMRLFFDSLSI